MDVKQFKFLSTDVTIQILPASYVKSLTALLALLGMILTGPVLAGPRVVVSIAPVHSLMSAVMDGIGTPELVIPPGQSPHTHSLAPSSVKHIYDAELIVWIGPGYEVALQNLLDQVDDNAMVRAIEEFPGLISLPTREGGRWESHDSHLHPQGDQATEYEQPGIRTDPHFWLSTSNAISMVEWFSEWLVSIDPENSSTYQANTESTVSRIREMQSVLQQLLLPVDDIPYIVFHDAYQYFEKEFGLRAIGSVTISPERPPGAKTIRSLRKVMEGNGVKCIFSEPQFEPRLVSTLIENTGVSVDQLDPLGAELNPGPELWYQVMTKLGKSLRDCLEQ